MAHPRGKQHYKYINNKQRLTGTLSLTAFRTVPKLMANQIQPPWANENPGTAATGPGFNTKSEQAKGIKKLSTFKGETQ